MTRCLALAERMSTPPRFFLDPGGEWETRLATTEFVAAPESVPGQCGAILAAVKAGEIGACLFDGFEIDGGGIARAAETVFTASFTDGAAPRGASLSILPTFGGQANDNLLAGPEFAPLASSYAVDLAWADRPAASNASRVLVAFGARDSANATGRVLDAIELIDSLQETTIVLGPDAPHREDVARRTEALTNAKIIFAPEHMIPIYQSADLAIGAPGVSFLERLCCGVPTLLVCQNAGQRPIAEAAVREGAAELADDDDAPALARRIMGLLANVVRRTELRRRGRELVDGRGAERLARALESRRGKYADARA